jgi:hypothetical protein
MGLLRHGGIPSLALLAPRVHVRSFKRSEAVDGRVHVSVRTVEFILHINFSHISVRAKGLLFYFSVKCGHGS